MAVGGGGGPRFHRACGAFNKSIVKGRRSSCLPLAENNIISP